MAKSKRRTIIITALIVTAAIAAGLVGAYYIYQRSYYMLEYEDIIIANAKEFELDPNLVAAVIHTESRFRKDAVSSKGASGLMQIMPEVGEWIAGKLKMEDYSLEKLFEPEVSIRLGCWQLRYLHDRFGGDRELALAAYNAGQGNVDKWLANKEYSKDGKKLDKIPFPETRNFVARVQKAYEKYVALYNIGE